MKGLFVFDTDGFEFDTPQPLSWRRPPLDTRTPEQKEWDYWREEMSNGFIAAMMEGDHSWATTVRALVGKHVKAGRPR